MRPTYAAYIIQRAWLSYLAQRAPEFTCHPGPFCGDWLCPGNCGPPVPYNPFKKYFENL